MVRDRASGETKGLAYELGQEFARRLNIPFEPVEFTQIADVLDALKRGAVDFTVTNASPARAKDVDFTAQILGVELGYLVSPRSSIATLADVDVRVFASVSPRAALRTPRCSASSNTRRWCRRRRSPPRSRCWQTAESTPTRRTKRSSLKCRISRRGRASSTAGGGSRCSQWASRRAVRLPCQRSEDLQTKRDPRGSSSGRRSAPGFAEPSMSNR